MKKLILLSLVLISIVLVSGCTQTESLQEPKDLILTVENLPSDWSPLRSSELNISEVSSKALSNGWSKGYGQKFQTDNYFIDYTISFYDNTNSAKNMIYLPKPEEIEFGPLLESIPPTNIIINEKTNPNLGDLSIAYEVVGTYDYSEDLIISYYVIQFAKKNILETLFMLSFESDKLDYILLKEVAEKAESKIV
ncbi:MAG: hypothetical protein KJ906_03590 [Nanoarchaeota archaeon]|nr:hypothetical protein [Nanoarchaeota archaeon]